MLLAVALCSRKNMNVFVGLPRCRSGEKVLPALALDLEVVAAWVYSPPRGYTSLFDGGSIRLLHRVFQPVFFQGMRRNALNLSWTWAELRLGGGLLQDKFFCPGPKRSNDLWLELESGGFLPGQGADHARPGPGVRSKQCQPSR